MKSLLLLIILFGIFLCLTGLVVLLSGETDGLIGIVIGTLISLIFFMVYTEMKWDNDFISLFIRTRLKRGSQKMKSAKNKMREELDDEQQNL